MRITLPNRRRFLRRLAILLGAPAAPILLGWAGDDDPIDTTTLEALLDTLIPADADPGALQAGVPETVLAWIRDDPAAAAPWRRLLAWLQRASVERHGTAFHALTPARRDALVSGLYLSGGDELARPRVDLHLVLADCFHAFYSSPTAQAVIGYHPPIQGGYPGYADSPAPRA